MSAPRIFKLWYHILSYSFYLWIFTIYLPFSETISGPPESPGHESLTLLLSPAQRWKLHNKSCQVLAVKQLNTILIPLNPAWIMVITLLVRDDLHLSLLECWCWTATRGGQPPPSHRGHLASVQRLGGGGEADCANGGGEGQGEAQEEDGEVVVRVFMLVSWVASDLGHISPVHISVRSVVLPHQHLQGKQNKE